MLSTFALSTLVGLASAIPTSNIIPPFPHNGPHHGPPSPPSTNQPQQPFKFPLANGFPNIANPSDALNKIQLQAGGTLPNTTLPSSIADLTATTFQLIAFNELFEVAFFSSLLSNITNNVPGFEISSPAAKQIVLNALTAVLAQEELHTLGANGILAAAGREQIQPCQYIFPTADFDSAISLASTFTDVVLGTLQDALNNFGKDGDIVFLPLIGSVIGQEGEQNGFYRLLSSKQTKIPSQLPFLTRSAGAFAFSALNQMFIVPESCPNPPALPIFSPLSVNTQNISLADQTLSFTTTLTNLSESNAIVYINQQNLPITQPIKNIKKDGKFEAFFPGKTNFLNGFTIAAVTKSQGPFGSVEDVVADTLAGPGLIEIN